MVTSPNSSMSFLNVMNPKDSPRPVSTIKTIDLGSFLLELSRRLGAVSETPALDAQVLTAGVMQHPRSWLLAHPELLLDQTQIALLYQAADRLLAGEPLPYVLGHWEFYGLDFHVSPDVLIPRPETELLVEKALAWLASHPAANQVADVGTGSGCIAITLAVHAPGRSILACDRSPAALEIAYRNAARHGVTGTIHFVQSDLLDGVETIFDLVCANLPYIPTANLASLKVAGSEPNLALDGGPDGLALIHRLIISTPRFLSPGGILLMEIESDQGQDVVSFARSRLPNTNVDLFQDLGGHDRLVVIQSA